MDIIGAADYLIKQGIVDENRMGIAGWSYGGISTNYTIATDQRFKAAVSGAVRHQLLGSHRHAVFHLHGQDEAQLRQHYKRVCAHFNWPAVY